MKFCIFILTSDVKNIKVNRLSIKIIKLKKFCFNGSKKM